MKQTPTLNRRSGFTLVEILIVMSIIAILVALLLPAIAGVRKNARIAQVKTDIGSIEAGLAQFQAHFGTYPPSRITLCNNSTDWASHPRSKAIIRRLWPSFDFSTDGAGGTLLPASGASTLELDGAECLAFFLGGVREDNAGVPGGYIGFSKNPRQPFLRNGQRLGPFMDLSLDRVVNSDSDGAPEYVDTLPGQTQPYIYLSSYDGRGYETADLGGRMTIYYTQGGSTAWKNKSFQVISPGFDAEYGPGGLYADDGLVGPGREAEADNITNFSNGLLGD